MALKDINQAAVLRAIAECDEIGTEEFRRRHGFGEARWFHLEHNGRRYDSKAIVGVAHGYMPSRRALRPDEFSGGRETVKPLLERLGFRVIKVGSPPWAWDELVLVCDLMAFPRGSRQPWYRLLEEHPEVVELSELLQRLPLHPVAQRPGDFRTPGAVARKGENIRQWHEGFEHGQNNGGSRDQEVHDAFIADPHEMHLMAEAIRAELLAGRLDDLPSEDEVDEGILEGSLLVRRHRAHERNPALRRKKINEVVAEHGRLACEVCTFDFERTYGQRGLGFAEVHHVVPLHTTGPVMNRTADLAILCSNCHRMIHRGTQWMTPAELRGLLRT